MCAAHSKQMLCGKCPIEQLHSKDEPGAPYLCSFGFCDDESSAAHCIKSTEELVQIVQQWVDERASKTLFDELVETKHIDGSDMIGFVCPGDILDLPNAPIKERGCDNECMECWLQPVISVMNNPEGLFDINKAMQEVGLVEQSAEIRNERSSDDAYHIETISKDI